MLQRRQNTNPRHWPRKGLLWPLAAALGGFLVMAGASPAQAQMFNPFGSNTGSVMTKADYAAGRAAATRLLDDDTPAVGRYESWTNPTSGNHGVLTIQSIFTKNDMPCRTVRSYVEYSKKGSAPYSAVLDVCKLATGEWKIV